MTEIYIGAAVSDAPKWWRDRFYPMVVEEIESIPGVDVTRFEGFNPTDPIHVHDFDLKLAQSGDVMVALTRYPSSGLGYEVRSRVELRKPTLYLQPADVYLTSMLRGAPHTKVVHYEGQKRDGRMAAKDIARRVAAELRM